VVERLAADLRAEFPDMRGFSDANIWRMRSKNACRISVHSEVLNVRLQLTNLLFDVSQAQMLATLSRPFNM